LLGVLSAASLLLWSSSEAAEEEELSLVSDPPFHLNRHAQITIHEHMTHFKIALTLIYELGDIPTGYYF